MCNLESYNLKVSLNNKASYTDAIKTSKTKLNKTETIKKNQRKSTNMSN